MTSGVERDAYIRAQYYAGRSAIELGAELRLSRSQVHRIVAAGPPANDADTDAAGDDEDPWVMGEDGLLQSCGDLASGAADVRRLGAGVAAEA